MTLPTRHEQAQAILRRRARKMAKEILGRQPVGAADFASAFTLERIDLIAEIPDVDALRRLGRTVVGPANDLYILHDPDGSFRVYVQERGEPRNVAAGLDFEAARDAVIDRLILLNGIPLDL